MSEVTDEIVDGMADKEIQNILNGFDTGVKFDFFDYVGKIVNGDIPFSGQDTVDYIISGIKCNISANRNVYIMLIITAVAGAIITNFSKLLQGKKVSEMAFYSVYMVFVSMLTVSFCGLAVYSSDTLFNTTEFIKVFSLTFFGCVTFVDGGTTGTFFCEFVLLLINLVDVVIIKFIFPAIKIYFFLQIASKLSEEDMFSRFAELIKDIVNLSLKTMLGVVMGANVVQGLVVPASQQVKNSVMVKIGSSIPGIGSVIGNVTETVLCAGKLVKNAVGITGIIAVVIICAIPLLGLVVSRFIYQVISAVMQPVSDKRITGLVDAVVMSLRLQIYTVFVGSMMFILSIAIVSVFT